MKDPVLSMRSAMTAALVTLALVGAVVAGALILLTSFLHRTTLTLNSAIEGMRIVEGIERDLVEHGRTPDPTLQAAVEGDIDSLLALAHRFELDARERQAIDRMAEATRRYFSAYRAARQSGLNAEQATIQSTAELGDAFSEAKHYRDTQLAQALNAQDEARAFDALANWVGLAAGLLILLVTGGVLAWVWSTLAPVRHISEAIQRFGGGDEESRAPVKGSSEAREIARRFNEMAAELSRRQHLGLAYVSGIVHDLRNPLAALQLAIARLDPEQARLTDEQLRSTVALVRRQLDQLNRMTGDLLDAARIRGGHLELRRENRDVRELARESVELFRPGTVTHELTFQASDEAAVVSCDALRIEQVINNLISNAIKYSPTGSSVGVKVERSQDEAVIAVTDAGVGITAEDLPRIFEPFRRTGPARDMARGVGLGLYVAKRIVEAHQGTIEVVSVPGEGSTFEVRLPLRDVPPATDPPGPRSPETATPGRAG